MSSPDTPAALGAPGVTETEWQDLALQSRNVFATPEWLGSWHRHEPAAAGTFTLVQRRADGRLAALLPLAVHHRLPRVLRPVGPWPSVGGPLICAEQDQAWAVTAFSAQLAQRGGWDVVEMFGVPSEQPWLDRRAGFRFARQPSSVVDLAGGGWDQLLQSSASSFRRDVRRRQRRLHERYAVEFRLADAATLHADVATFYRLHRARWGESVNILTPGRTALLHDFAARALDRGWLALWTMHLDGQPAAAVLDLRYAGREIGFMAGRDPKFDADYVGLTVLFHAIEQAGLDGMTEFEMMRGDQPYKSRLPHEDRMMDDIALSRGPAGRATVAALRARDELRRSRDQGGTPVRVVERVLRVGRRAPGPDGQRPAVT